MSKIDLFKVFMSPHAGSEVAKVLESGFIGQGPKVEEFERQLKQWFNRDYVVTVNSGTSGLHLALHLLKKDWPSDAEVLCTPMTCLEGRTPILLDDGSTKTIKQLVDSKYDGKIVSFNTETNQLELKQVINWYKSLKANRFWIHIRYNHSTGSINDNYRKGIWVTNDHPILTPNGYIEAQDLKTGDLVVTGNRRPTKEIESAIVGMLLGDSGIQNSVKFGKTARLTTGHVFTQNMYGDLKHQLLKEFGCLKYLNTGKKQTKDNYCWLSSFSPYFYDLKNRFYPKGIKVIPNDLSKDELTELSLAIWYMDDGSLHKRDHYAVICTDCFSKDDSDRLCNLINDKFGLESKTLKHKRNGSEFYRVYFSKRKAVKFLKLIAPYIPQSMRYKLTPEIDKEIPFNMSLWDIKDQTMPYIDSITISKGSKDLPRKGNINYVYCLDVADNHNFIAGNIVVHNCTASNMPVLMNGLKIKWVDIDPTTMNMDLDDLARKISPKTRAIIPVHWGGYVNNLDRLAQIQEDSKEIFGFKPSIIEDCAHAMGSRYKGKLLGNHGNIAMYSFQAIKHFTCVDGGALIFPHEELYKKAKLQRWYGIDREGARRDFRCEADILEYGSKFHMNDVNAAVGLANLSHAWSAIIGHKSNAKFYDANLKDISGLTLMKREVDVDSAFWIYSMLVERREDFTRMMAEKGIAVSQVHERNDKHTCFREFKSHLPNLDRVTGHLTNIPVGWWLTEEDRQYICDAIKSGW